MIILFLEPGFENRGFTARKQDLVTTQPLLRKPCLVQSTGVDVKVLNKQHQAAGRERAAAGGGGWTARSPSEQRLGDSTESKRGHPEPPMTSWQATTKAHLHSRSTGCSSRGRESPEHFFF